MVIDAYTPEMRRTKAMRDMQTLSCKPVGYRYAWRRYPPRASLYIRRTSGTERAHRKTSWRRRYQSQIRTPRSSHRCVCLRSSYASYFLLPVSCFPFPASKLPKLTSHTFTAELEAQLREKEQIGPISANPNAFHGVSMPPQLSPLARLTIGPFGQFTTGLDSYPTPYSTTNPTADPAVLQQSDLRHHGPSMDITDPIAAIGIPPYPGDSQTPGMAAGTSAVPAGGSPLAAATDTNAYTTMLWPHWPERLPSPPLLNHLVETFFASHPHANRLLHRPTFMASLQLPPTHQDFPALSLLHAICALASIWSPAVEHENMPDLQNRPAEEIFQEAERRRIREQRAQLGLGASNGINRGDWFGEVQAKWSREEEEKNATEGTAVFQGLQCEFLASLCDLFSFPSSRGKGEGAGEAVVLMTNHRVAAIVVLTWYYYAHARWVEVWLYTAKALRYAVPMGLNTTATHGPLLRSWTMPSILGPPKDAIEVRALVARGSYAQALARPRCAGRPFGSLTVTNKYLSSDLWISGLLSLHKVASRLHWMGDGTR